MMLISVNWNVEIEKLRRQAEQAQILLRQAEQERIEPERLRIASEQEQTLAVLEGLHAREKLLGLRDEVWGIGEVFYAPGNWSTHSITSESVSKNSLREILARPRPADFQRLDLQPSPSGCTLAILELKWPKYCPTTKSRLTGYRWAYIDLEYRALAVVVVYRGVDSFGLSAHPIYSGSEAPVSDYDVAHGEYNPGDFKLTITGDQRPDRQLDEILIQDSLNRKYKYKEIPYAAIAIREATEAAAKLESLQANRNIAQWRSWTQEFFERYSRKGQP